MAERSDPLSAIRRLVEQKKYRIRIHAVQHMIREGFNEDDIIEVLRSPRTEWTCKTKTMVADRNKTSTNSIKRLMRNRCTECGGSPKKSVIAQEFENEGVVIRISGIQAWVCAKCGEIYFEPGGAQRMAEAVRSLFALARAEKQHKGTVVADLS